MATRYIGQVTPSVGVQFQTGRANVVAAASGGTLAGSQVVQVVFDDSVFTSSLLDKQALVAAVLNIATVIQSARSWPLDTTS